MDGPENNLLRGEGFLPGKKPADASAPSSRNGKGPLRVGHIRVPRTPKEFAKLLDPLCLERIVIPEAFLPSLGTTLELGSSREMTVKTNGGCLWLVTMKTLSDGQVILGDGWPYFVIAHKLQIGYALTFKLVEPTVLKVTTFGLDRTEIVSKCDTHPCLCCP